MSNQIFSKIDGAIATLIGYRHKHKGQPWTIEVWLRLMGSNSNYPFDRTRRYSQSAIKPPLTEFFVMHSIWRR